MLCLGGEWILRASGQDSAVAAGAAQVLHILGFSLPGNALFLTTAFFLEAIKRPMPAVVVIVAANLLNAGLNLLLVFGEPALGAVGSAVATSAARWFMALALIAYVLLMPGHGAFAVRAKVARWWADSATARQIGYASGVSSALEASAFGSMTIFAGWFGASILAAYAIALNAWSLVFMSAIGLGIGAAVRVGHAAGAGDRPGHARGRLGGARDRLHRHDADLGQLRRVPRRAGRDLHHRNRCCAPIPPRCWRCAPG